MTDIATRVYNHTWKIDPIVRSVLDTDFYKLLMAQTIFRRHKDARVTFGILNRTRSVKLARLVDVGELKEQLDHIRTLSLSRGEFDLAARQLLLRQAAHVLARLHPVAGGLPLSRLSPGARGRPVRADLRGAVDRDHHVGDPGAGRADGAALARGHQGDGQVRAAGALRPRHDARVGEDRPAEGVAGSQHRRLRHPPAPRLPVAGLVRAGDDGGAGAGVPRHLQLPDRHAARGGGDRHQRARAADGLLRAGSQRQGAGRGPLQGAGRLAGGLRRQPARHAARYLRHARLPGAGARLGGAVDRRARGFRATPSKAARSPSTGGGGAVRTRT